MIQVDTGIVRKHAHRLLDIANIQFSSIPLMFVIVSGCTLCCWITNKEQAAHQVAAFTFTEMAAQPSVLLTNIRQPGGKQEQQLFVQTALATCVDGSSLMFEIVDCKVLQQTILGQQAFYIAQQSSCLCICADCTASIHTCGSQFLYKSVCPAG